ncbi:hypothetical protein HYT02_02630 [Candidatus Gottesmanbacteria bacterium]|nr:hypothetical protein [Candidatus Gottesmanbacteria bacterium]
MEIIKQVHAEVDIITPFKPAQTFPTIGSLINVLAKNAMVFAGIIFFIMFIYAGFKYIQAAGKGDPAEIQKANSLVGASMVGLLLVVGAYFIVYIIETVTGIKILNPGF